MITVDSAMYALYTTVGTSEYTAESSYTTVRSYTPTPIFEPKPQPFSPMAPLLHVEFQVDTLGK